MKKLFLKYLFNVNTLVMGTSTAMIFSGILVLKNTFFQISRSKNTPPKQLVLGVSTANAVYGPSPVPSAQVSPSPVVDEKIVTKAILNPTPTPTATPESASAGNNSASGNSGSTDSNGQSGSNSNSSGSSSNESPSPDPTTAPSDSPTASSTPQPTASPAASSTPVPSSSPNAVQNVVESIVPTPTPGN